jgi:hypothetical protein
MVRAILKLSPHLKNHKFNPLNPSNNALIQTQLKAILKELPTSLNLFNEDLMFQNAEIKEEFKHKFKNVTRLMDCVTCDRCRLWGKIQSTGYATALKVLFSDNVDVFHDLSKNEIASLFNTFDRLTKSISAINQFNYKDLLSKRELQPTIETEPKTTEIKKSSAPKAIISQKDKSVREKFDDEIKETGEALKFIWFSYVNLPHNLKNIALYKLNQWWNAFMGLKPQESAEEYLHNIIV